MILVASDLYDALRDVCIDAWNVAKVHYGLPRVEITSYPHVVIRLASVPAELLIGTIEQVYTFDVILRQQWSNGTNIELDKIQRANEFLAAFTQSKTLGQYGLMPMVNEVSFVESDDPNEPFYEVAINVSTIVHSSWAEV